nr:hypothetical protein [uncultured Holophaga sp.]
MRKSLAISLCILCACLGFLGGAIAATKYWVRPNHVFTQILADSFSTFVDLTELRRSHVDSVIQSKELQLDGHIIALGIFANERNENGQKARKFLRKISAYRSKVDYKSNHPEFDPKVKEILQLASLQP